MFAHVTLSPVLLQYILLKKPLICQGAVRGVDKDDNGDICC